MAAVCGDTARTVLYLTARLFLLLAQSRLPRSIRLLLGSFCLARLLLRSQLLPSLVSVHALNLFW